MSTLSKSHPWLCETRMIRQLVEHLSAEGIEVHLEHIGQRPSEGWRSAAQFSDYGCPDQAAERRR